MPSDQEVDDNYGFARKRRKRLNLQEPAIDRLPPHSLEAEQAVLGAILMAPECVAECFEEFRGNTDVFYDLRHATIYGVFAKMYHAKEPIELISVIQKLKDQNCLEGVGGIAYLSSLDGTIETAVNLKSHAKIVWNKYLLRKGVTIASELVGKIYDSEGDVDLILNHIESELMGLAQLRASRKIVSAKEVMVKVWDELEARNIEGAPDLAGLSTGLIDLDKLTKGLPGGELIVLAARPGVGKSSAAMNIADFVAIGLGEPVGVFTLEMRAQALMSRAINARSGIDMSHGKKLSIQDFPRVLKAREEFDAAPIHFCEERGIDILDLKAKARGMVSGLGVKLLVIDYLQIIRFGKENRFGVNKGEMIGQIAQHCKWMAEELNVPVLLLSQLNRDSTKQQRRPTMADLRSSGDIENHADKILLLHKKEEEEDDQRTMEIDCCEIDLYVDKNRSGPTGKCRLLFFPPLTKFVNASKISAEDVPTQTQQEWPETKQPYPD